LLSVGRLRGRVIILATVIVALLAGGTWFALTHAQAKQAGPAAAGGHGQQHASQTSSSTGPLQVVSVTPASHARNVNGAAPVRVQFSAAVAASSPLPHLTPATPGSWQGAGTKVLEFVPAKGFAPQTHVTVHIPGGKSGVTSATGSVLAHHLVVRYRVGSWSDLRLDQLLA
jgi:hypothetical protein